jgi:hypothetical protein
MGLQLVQSAFRFRNDDGTETTATWKVPQNQNTSITVGRTIRIRFQIDAYDDQPEKQFKLQYRKVGDVVWKDVQVG